MFFKIQPEQIQIHAFSSPSGDMRFFAGSNYVYANLSRYLTGVFDISGSLSVNGVALPVADSTNFTSGSNSFAFGGVDNDVIGVRNTEVNGDSCSILGTGNAAFNSRFADFDAASTNNTALGGYGADFNGVTGATVLKDGQASVVASNGNNSLTISYGSGTFIENGNLTIKAGNLNVGAGNSGLFSGDLHALGSIYRNGVALATTGDIYVTSGVLDGKLTNSGSALSTRINNTGSTLLAVVAVLSGESVLKTSDQTISGEKTFHQSTIFSQSIYLKGNSGVLSGVSGATQIVPTGSGDSAGARGLVSFSGAFLFYKISDNPNLWVRHSGQLSWP